MPNSLKVDLMCLIQIFSDTKDCGTFHYLDEDIWLERSGRYLLIVHMILEVQTDISNIKMILHGKLINPKKCSLHSDSWKIESNGIIFNRTFSQTDIFENKCEGGYTILNGSKIEIEGITAKVVPEKDISFNSCDKELKECTCVGIEFKNQLLAKNTYAMRIGFYMNPPQSRLRYIFNKIKYQIHYYTTLSINPSDGNIIRDLNNRAIPLNPKKSSIFIYPPHNIQLIEPSIASSYYYERYCKPLSTAIMKKPRTGFRWDPDGVMRNPDMMVTSHNSTPLSFTFRRFDPGHIMNYIALGLVVFQILKGFNFLNYYIIFVVGLAIFYGLSHHTLAK